MKRMKYIDKINDKYIDKINDIKKERNISIRSLSMDCDLTELALKNILSKKSVPSVASVAKICEALKIPMADLFCEDDETVIKNDCQTALILGTFDALSNEAQSHLLWISCRLKGH